MFKHIDSVLAALALDVSSSKGIDATTVTALAVAASSQSAIDELVKAQGDSVLHVSQLTGISSSSGAVALAAIVVQADRAAPFASLPRVELESVSRPNMRAQVYVLDMPPATQALTLASF